MSNPTDKASVAALVARMNAMERRYREIDEGEFKALRKLLREAARALPPAQGGGMRDALVTDAMVEAGLDAHYPDWRVDGQSEARKTLMHATLKAALASYPDRQPGMTDEQAEDLLIEQFRKWKNGDIEAKDIAAIKRASQRQ